MLTAYTSQASYVVQDLDNDGAWYAVERVFGAPATETCANCEDPATYRARTLVPGERPGCETWYCTPCVDAQRENAGPGETWFERG
jgi:hypothetical protein